ncbi:MAG: S-methyl-5'-thioinosine phosphorylase [Gammaproteobacteria bacterium]|nr:S-methyl-5'-thioinosine phosphorylase [Gammaproteobacteria bacterium]
MSEIGIIGGTGLTSLPELEIVRREVVYTPYGEPSGPVSHGVLNGVEVAFLARHGLGHTIPPHRVNYRANIWALKSIGVRRIVAVAAVGGIRSDMAPGSIAIPDQIIDYTYGRSHTFFEHDLEEVKHIDFTEPYCGQCRGVLIDAARAQGLAVIEDGTYAAAQGPRLETAAEVNRLERDGCDIVGMTGMPETALARELDLSYACCAVIANWAAGRGEVDIHADIEANLANGMDKVKALLQAALPDL